MTETNKLAYKTDAQLRELTEDQPKSLAEEQAKLEESFKELKVQGAPKQVIMDALGITEDDYAKLSSNQAIKDCVIQAEISKAKTSQVFDNNWDLVENLALKQVARELQISPDPEYALKAAAVANKAIRRQREDARLAMHQQAAQYNTTVNANQIAILSLPKVFMQQLSNETTASASKQIAIQKDAISQPKLMDSADVSKVKDAFGFDAPLVGITNQIGIKADSPASLASLASPEVVSDEEFERWLTDGK